MKHLKHLSLLFVALFFAFSSCDKDDDTKNDEVAEGKMITMVNNSDVNFDVNAISYTAIDDGRKYEYVSISGVAGSMGTSENSSFIITVYAEDVKSATYILPALDNIEEYDFFKGYATGYYFTSADSTSYISYFAKNSTGSVTIEEISASVIKGNFDLVLTSTKDETKTIALKGNFNAKIISINTTIEGN